MLLLAVGVVWFLYHKKGDDENNKVLKEAALDYFDKYVSVYSASSAYKITLKDLKKAETSYDLKMFEKCDDENTYVIITINNANGKVIDTEIRKKC